jgi:hypothetical protein
MMCLHMAMKIEELEADSESWGGERSESLQRSPEEVELEEAGETPDEPISMNPEGVIEASRKPREEIDDEEALDILSLFKKSAAKGYAPAQIYRYIGRCQGRHPKTIENFLRRHRSTVELAQIKLKASASKIVQKVIEKAPTHELIDLLSRPNIGVLEPMKKQDITNNGFIINVQADSLGAVKVGQQNVIEEKKS